MSLSGGLLRIGRHATSSTIYGRASLQAFLNTDAKTRISAPSNSIPSSITLRLQEAVANRNLVNIHRFYTDYVHRIKSTAAQNKNISSRQPRGLNEILFLLAASGRPRDLALIEQIFKDSRTVFNATITDEMHALIIKGLLRNGNMQTAYRWLMTLPKKTGQFTSQSQWLLFLEHCMQLREVGMMRQSLKTMQQSGCKPTNDAFALILRALFVSDARVRAFDQAFDDAQREGLPFDNSIAQLVYDGFAKLGRVDRAAQVEALYYDKFHNYRLTSRAQRHERIRTESRKGVKAAIAMCLTFQVYGFRPNDRTLTMVLGSSTKLSDLRYAEKSLQVQANVVHWSMLIVNLIRLGDLPNALSLYDQSQEAGIVPDVAMVQPIINALCYPPLARPAEAAIDRALDIFQHLCHAEPTPDNLAPLTPSHNPNTPNAQIYNILLRTLASADNAQKYVPKALSLLKDMELRAVEIESSMAVTSVTILLMRSAMSHAEAVDIVKTISGSKHGPGLDAKGYAAVLSAFCRLSFDKLNLFPALDHYFDIVSIMQQAGHSPTAEVYTILLRHLTQGSLNLTSVTRLDLHRSVRQIHDWLVLDTSLRPDVTLWNQLMDTYQRIGSVVNAHGIWDMLFVSDQYNNASISIIFDACAFAQEWPLASRICSRLFDAGFPLNQHNWNGWLECLCRLGKLDEAVKLACLEMGRNQQDVAPNIETVRILLKFAKGANQSSKVLSEIKQHLPVLAAGLSKEL